MYSVAATSTPVGVASRPTSAKKARTATVVRATKDSKSEDLNVAPDEDFARDDDVPDEETPPEDSGFWRKVFLPDGKEEVKAGDYQKFQAELKAQKEANAKKAAEKEGGCVIM